MSKAIKRIVCPVDVYDFQPEAAEYAVMLAEALDSKISAVYVMNPVPLHLVGEGKLLLTLAEEKEMTQAAEVKLGGIISGFFSPYADKGEVVLGHAAEQVIRIAEESSADVIVMASHGRSALGRVIHGSVTSKVLAGTKIPVLVIQPSKED